YVATKNDKTFLMFDLDVDGMLEHLQGIQDAVLLVSNPCIELWYLLHFEECHAELTQKACIKKLKRHFEYYAKGTLALGEKQKLSEKTSEAMARAKVLETYNNPSTTIYKMIELLENL
ncbi:MAG: RloB domain-containing protein, partial [Muribaculaceae bacterium]|nr:RloB domain-containing protein [Muribaculaceae bacterium]